MLLGSGHRRKNESWYWLPPPPSLAPSPSSLPSPVYQSILTSISHSFLNQSSPFSWNMPGFFLQSYVRQVFWGGLACSRAERCILITAWLAQRYSLDERGGGGREDGEGVLSRGATSSQCVESIFSRVNRGIPAHWSWLHSAWRQTVVLHLDVNGKHFFLVLTVYRQRHSLSSHRLGLSGRNTAPQIDGRSAHLSLSAPYCASHAWTYAQASLRK